MIGAALGTGKVSLRDLEEYYSIEDVYLIVEVASVEAYNAYRVNAYHASRHDNR